MNFPVGQLLSRFQLTLQREIHVQQMPLFLAHAPHNPCDGNTWCRRRYSTLQYNRNVPAGEERLALLFLITDIARKNSPCRIMFSFVAYDRRCTAIGFVSEMMQSAFKFRAFRRRSFFVSCSYRYRHFQ
jgi:hypothetical protein